MGFLEILLIAVSMAMDAFAVCLGAGASARVNNQRQVFRLSFHFGLFQFLLPVIGWFAGRTLADLIAAYDHWVAFGLLALVGGRMIHAGLSGQEESRSSDPSRGITLVMLSIAVSIDALAIGLSLALIGVTIWYPAVMIGLITGLLSWLGIKLGSIASRKLGKSMEVAGGIVLLLIGLRIVLEHLFS